MKITCFFIITLLAACFLNSCSRPKMPADFNFRFHFDFTEYVNTADSTYTRSTINGDTTISFTFTRVEMQGIYEVMIENDFETLPYSFITGKGGCIQPHSSDRIRITCDSMVREINHSFDCEPARKELADKYFNIREKIMDVIRSRKSELKKLPESGMIFM